MAYDKVIDSSALDSKLKAVADAIRGKTGNTNTLTLDQMPAEIAGIQNEIPDGYIDKFIDRSITEISSNITGIGAHAFYGCTELARVDLPLLTNIGAYAFYGCTALTSVDFPLVTNIETYAFRGCTALARIDCPLVTAIAAYAFYGCTALTRVDFPLLTRLCVQSFRGCSELATLTLRKGSRVPIDNVNALAETKIAGGTGYIYVPASLITSYKSHSIWSTYASQFRALEDYTVDGTITGALDESKI